MEKLLAIFAEWELHTRSCSVCHMFERSTGAPTRSFFVVCIEGRSLLMQITNLVAELSRGSA